MVEPLALDTLVRVLGAVDLTEPVEVQHGAVWAAKWNTEHAKANLQNKKLTIKICILGICELPYWVQTSSAFHNFTKALLLTSL
jgi:hypothetical protein